jgi:chemotaxis protein CheX
MSTAATATKPPELDKKLIIPFINSTREVMRTMLRVETTIERPFVRAATAGPAYDCSGIISFSGDVVGVVVCSFPQATALKLVEAFAGAALPHGSSDFVDALGELTNMIAGAAKKDIGLAASISVPTVILGANHHVAAGPSDVPCLCVPCVTALGAFEINICVKQI